MNINSFEKIVPGRDNPRTGWSMYTCKLQFQKQFVRKHCTVIFKNYEMYLLNFKSCALNISFL